MKLDNYVWSQWGLGVLLNVVDFFSTKKYVAVMGPYGELNPILRWIINIFGIDGISYVKAIAWFVMAACITHCIITRQDTNLSRIGTALMMCNIIMGVVVGWGIYSVMTL